MKIPNIATITTTTPFPQPPPRLRTKYIAISPVLSSLPLRQYPSSDHPSLSKPATLPSDYPQERLSYTAQRTGHGRRQEVERNHRHPPNRQGFTPNLTAKQASQTVAHHRPLRQPQIVPLTRR